MSSFIKLIGRAASRATRFRMVSTVALIGICLTSTCVVLRPSDARAEAAPQQLGVSSSPAKAVGAINSIAGNSLTLTTDDGNSISISVSGTTRIVRIAPGQTDLKNATAITLQDLQVGDRVLVRGRGGEGGQPLLALSLIVMKKSDVTAKQEQEREDWQKRGVGGIVTEIDPAAHTVTISVTSMGGTRKIAIQASNNTIIRRYAPNSVKFNDAKPSKFADIRTGDQLRARGNKNADGTELAAEEIVAGSFRNIAGTIIATDAASSSLTVMDAITKRPVMVKVTPDSQLRKLPQLMAHRIAMRLKGQTPEGLAVARGIPPTTVAARPEGSPPQGVPGQNGGGIARGGGDLQQMLSRLPVLKANDFQKGDVVMLVSTQGTETEVTVITLVGGVEPILTAASAGSQAMTLSPWSLSGAAEEGATQ